MLLQHTSAETDTPLWGTGSVILIDSRVSEQYDECVPNRMIGLVCFYRFEA